ncbi:serine/threonine-protein kinase PknK [candidate division CSSED10-310 bacterium]|uniref:Serine/threonine-protein kinase PknK n=1 Tax=candidate division CSSED10-310 bacterium TaxID=2855610 RepID=A0ABV6YR92_UNCC1
MRSESNKYLGPYRIIEQLGQGGMGLVYHAEHPRTGTQVALKTVLVPHENLLQSIRREIHTLSKLKHRGIVRIIEQGICEGLPWYAMEWLQGDTLRQHFFPQIHPEEQHDLLVDEQVGIQTGGEFRPEISKTWWTSAAGAVTFSHMQSPLPPENNTATIPLSVSGLDKQTDNGHLLSQRPKGELCPPIRIVDPQILHEILNVMCWLCEPLAFLHGEGIVHRDLKPDNIVMNADKQPVIVDFGLFTQCGGEESREALALANMSAGTAPYMAPEQIRGEFVDARADLYSFGCILYELITGHCPFTGHIHQVVRQHIETPPTPPSQLVAPLDPLLDNLIMQLLAKDPRERLGYAQDVALRLKKLGAHDLPLSDTMKPRVYLYRSQLSGREFQLQKLHSHLAETRFNCGRIILIGGESGIGKTRLIMEFGHQALRDNVAVLTGESNKGSSQSLTLFRGLLQTIADRCRERGKEEADLLLGKRGRVLAEYESALRDLPGQDAYPEPTDLPAAAARLRLFSYLAEVIKILSRQQPLLLLLDDLQWADELSLDFVTFLCGGSCLDETPILIIGTYRSEEISQPLLKVLQAEKTIKLDLPRLGASAVAAIIEDMLALPSPPQIFSEYLTRQSEGNPFFVAEYLRTAVEEGLLWRDSKGNWVIGGDDSQPARSEDFENLAIPRSLRELANRRITGLPGAARLVLENASIIGREISLSLLDMMVKLEETAFNDGLEELFRRQVFEESEPGLIRFIHNKIREVTYDSIAESRKTSLHLAAATSIEKLYATELNEFLAELGYHWEMAGDLNKARQCYVAGARKAKRRYSYQEAERLYLAHLNLLEKPSSDSVTIRNEVCEEVYLVQGRNHEAIASLKLALEEARAMKDKQGEVSCLLNCAHAQWIVGQLDQALASNEEALQLCQSLKLEAGIAKSYGGLAVVHHIQGRFDEASTLYQRAAKLHRKLDNLESQAIALGNLGALRHDQGKTQQALRLQKQALSILRKIGAKRREAITLVNLGLVYQAQGDLKNAQALMEEALLILKDIGDKRTEAISYGNLGNIARENGELAAARKLYEQALTILQTISDRREEAYILYTLAVLTFETHGLFSEVVAFLEKAEKIFSDIGDPLRLALCACVRGHMALAQELSAQEFIVHIARLTAEIKLDPQSEGGWMINRLHRAQEAFKRQEFHHLHQGILLTDLPDKLRQWLRQQGYLS